MANDNRILASVALFSELYDQSQDVYHLVGEFLKSVVIAERTWDFAAADLLPHLKKHFDFKLPLAVVRNVLRTRLKKEGFCIPQGKDIYRVINPARWSADELNSEFLRLKASYDSIFEKLVAYSRAFTTGGQGLDESDLKRGFSRYLLGDSVNEEIARISSAFIVEFGSDDQVVRDSNLIREGLVILFRHNVSARTSRVGVVATRPNNCVGH